MKAENEPREGSYEASLTNDDRAALHSLLISGESLHEVREKAPLWGKGTGAGREAFHLPRCGRFRAGCARRR